MTGATMPKLVLTDNIEKYPLGSIQDHGFNVNLKKGDSFEIIDNTESICCFGTSKTMSGTIFIPVNNLLSAGKATILS